MPENTAPAVEEGTRIPLSTSQGREDSKAIALEASLIFQNGEVQEDAPNISATLNTVASNVMEDKATSLETMLELSKGVTRSSMAASDRFKASLMNQLTSEAVEEVSKGVATEDVVENLDVTNRTFDTIRNSSPILALFLKGANLKTVDAEEREELLKRFEGADLFDQVELSRMVVATTLAEMFDKLDPTFLEKAASISSLLLGGSAINLLQLSNALGVDFEDFTAEFQLLTPQEQALITPIIAEFVAEKTGGNFIDVTIFLDNIFNFKSFTSEKIFAGVDVLGIAGVTVGVVRSLAKAGRVINVLKVSGNTAEAGNVNAVVLSDKTGAAAKAAKTDRASAAGDTTGANWKQSAGIDEAVDNIAPETVVAIEKVIGQVEQDLTQISSKSRGVLNDEQRAAVEVKFLDDFKAQAKERDLGANIVAGSAPKVIGRTGDGFTIEVTTKRSANGKFIKEQNVSVDVKYNETDLGLFETKALNNPSGFLSGVWSPSVLLSNFVSDAGNIVKAATGVDFRAVSNLRNLEKATTKATKGLSREGANKLDEVLRYGDENQRVFSIDELKAGISTPDSIITLADNEIASYYGLRRILDETWNIKNQQVREELIFGRFKFTSMTATLPKGAKVNNTNVFFKDVSEGTRSRIASGAAAGERDGINSIYDYTRGELVSITDANIASRLADVENFNVVRVTGGPVRVTKADGTSSLFDVMLMPRKSVKNIPPVVLNNHKGYVPLIRENVFFTVRSRGTKLLNGSRVSRDAAGWRTEGLFSTRAEAEASAVKLQGAEIGRAKASEKSGGSGEIRQVELQQSDELEQANRDELALRSFGGLFGTSRTERDIIFGGNRVNAFESLDRNLRHVSSALPYNSFRLQFKQKFIDTFGDSLEAKAFNSPVKTGVTEIEREAINKSRDYFNNFLKIPPANHRAMARQMTKMAERLEAKGALFGFKLDAAALKARNLAISLNARDPYSYLRAATFHSLLGAFNPAQLLVQPQGAAAAFALDPLGAPKRLAEYFAVRSALYGRPPKKALDALSNAANNAEKGVMPKGRLEQLVGEIQESGLMDSILSNADYDGAIAGLSVSKNAISRAWAPVGRGLRGPALVFFREGETFARVFSYLAARARWVRKNPGKTPDGAARASILDESVAMTTNLNRANKAVWQEGVLSIPLQFQQITAKFMETMLGINKNFTLQERGRILAGQLVLYGSAGIPLGDALLRNLVSAGEQSFEEMTQEQQNEFLRFASEGTFEWVAEQVFGTRVALNDRFAMADGITRTIEGFQSMDLRPLDVLGAFGSIPNRLFQATSDSFLIFNPVEDDLPSTERFISGLVNYASVFSSIKNSRLAYRMIRGLDVRDSRGNVLITAEELDIADPFFQVLGFTPEKINSARELSILNFQIDAEKKEMTEVVTKAVLLYLEGDTSDPSRFEDHINAMRHINRMIDDPVIANEIYAAAFKRALDPRSKSGKAYRRYLDKVLSGEVALVSGSDISMLDIPARKREER